MRKRLPVEVLFPRPAFAVEPFFAGATLTVAARSWLGAVQTWRGRVETFLRQAARPADEDLTSRARAIFARLLGTKWDSATTDQAAKGPYAIGPFPEIDEHRADARSVVRILQWRSGVVDYLSDVWDVIGKPELELGECQALESLLTPEGADPLCLFCLQPFPKDTMPVDRHKCPLLLHVRSKWPEPPPGLRDLIDGGSPPPA